MARRRELLILSDQALNERIDEIIEKLRAIDSEALQKQISEQPDLTMLKYDLDGVDLYLANELEQYESFYELALIKVTTDINYVENQEDCSLLSYEIRKQFNLFADDVRDALVDIILAIQSELSFPDLEEKPIIALKGTARGSFIYDLAIGVMSAGLYEIIMQTVKHGRQPIKSFLSRRERVGSELPASVERNRAERGQDEAKYGITRTEERLLVDEALKQLRDRTLLKQDNIKHNSCNTKISNIA